jgi:hypothetical protein
VHSRLASVHRRKNAGSSAAGHAIIAARLYVPKGWADDQDRRRAAGIPEDLAFRTKPALAAEIVTQLLVEGRCPPGVRPDLADRFGRARVQG